MRFQYVLELLLVSSSIITTTSLISNNLIIVPNAALTWPGGSGSLYDPTTGQHEQSDNFGFSHGPLATASCSGKLYMSVRRELTIWGSKRNSSGNVDDVLHTSRSDHSMDCVNNGNDLVLCGGTSSQGMISCEVCHMNLPSPICVPLSDLPAPRWRHVSVTLSTEQLLIIGGYDSNGTSVNTVFSYSTKDNTWSTLPSMITARGEYPGAAVLDSNEVIVCGGRDADRKPLSSCEVLDADSMGWRLVAPMHEAKYSYGMVSMSDGSVYAMGSLTATGWSHFVEVYDLINDKWTNAAYNLTNDIFTFPATRLIA